MSGRLAESDMGAVCGLVRLSPSERRGMAQSRQMGVETRQRRELRVIAILLEKALTQAPGPARQSAEKPRHPLIAAAQIVAVPVTKIDLAQGRPGGSRTML